MGYKYKTRESPHDQRVLVRKMKKVFTEKEIAENAQERPKYRSECIDGPRPCPWVSCRHHLMIDYIEESGNIIHNYQDIDDMKQTCSLDVACGPPKSLDHVGQYLQMTRERVRQIEDIALKKFSEGIKENMINPFVED